MIAQLRSRSIGSNTGRLRAMAFMAALCFLPGAAAAQSDLSRARQLYNQGRFDESITTAEAARAKPKAAASAGLVIARARLERFRKSGSQQDLSESRHELLSLDPKALSASEAVEWNIGLGEALVLEHQFGPASKIFSDVIVNDRSHLTPAERDKLIEWWANAVATQAETLPRSARIEQYAGLLSTLKMMTNEKLSSRAAVYWSVVAARGVGDVEAAWNGAVAGWIRAQSMDGRNQLRADLEKFVTETLIPERAQARTGQPLDVRATRTEVFAITEEWRGVTERWGESP